MKDKFMQIPQEMQSYNQWIVWRYEETTGGKPTKVPYSAKAASLASVSNMETWCSFNQAVETSSNGYNGIGFVFTESDPYSGIDLDHSTEQLIINRQIEVSRKFDSYSEISPSGQGLHIICKGKVPSGRRRSCIEVYSEGRFFTMTGNIYNNKPIAERQELLDILWNEIGGPKPIETVGSLNEFYKDDEIIKMALNATNGEKFEMLIRGKWQDAYPSQSEADFAFIDILAFYTQSRNQISRMFRNSILGARDKANRSDYLQFMLNKAFDRILPTVDIEGLSNGFRLAQMEKHKTPDPITKIEMPNPYTVPPGLLGDIATFIYANAARPIPEVALAGAIGLMAGICGRGYNVSRTGLNMYILLLANTAVGKEAMASGINKIFNIFRTSVPASAQFKGPAQIASGQALLKYLSKDRPCVLSVFGEFGITMQQLANPRANNAELAFKKVLLDLYMKSGFHQIVDPSIYSQKENNTEPLRSPAFSILGESVPKTFYQAVDEALVEDGLLPRFLIIEYLGERPPFNEQADNVEPSFGLIDGVGSLMQNCLKLMQAGAVINVEMQPEAKTLANEINDRADAHIRKAGSGAVRELWSRVHIKLLRLAALVAVGVDPLRPIITVENIEWAKAIIEYETFKLLAKFEAGEVGSKPTDENNQVKDLKKVIKFYLDAGIEIINKYDLPTDMHRDKVIPYVYLQRRLIAMASFRNDRVGSTVAIKRAIGILVDSGIIAEVPRTQMTANYKSYQRAFVVSNARAIAGIMA